MTLREKLGALAVSVLIAGCASQPAANQSSTSAPAKLATQSKASNVHVVKSTNGKYDGEIIGTPAPKSRFAKLRIGMLMGEVTKLIGAPDDMFAHETGKRWIPFYFGNDAQRVQVMYKGEGCLTFTGGNVFGGGGHELITITVDAKGGCFDS